MKELKQLTVKQALEQGYDKWLYANRGFQGLSDLKSIEPYDFSKGKIELVHFEPYSPVGMSAKDIIELIADQIENDHSGESGDDTLQVWHSLKEIDEKHAQPLVDAIDAELQKLNYYKSSGIELIP